MKNRKKQCKACPWKKSTVPDRDIPGGYCATLHAGLDKTIKTEANLADISQGIVKMACHESITAKLYPCVGWLAHQLGRGNNLALRIEALDGRYNGLELDGEQHERFEDTLPRYDDQG